MSRWDLMSTYYSSRGANSVVTPVRRAVQKGISEIKRLVCETRVNVNYKDKTGLTAIHMATKIGCIDTKQGLFEVGVTVNVKNGELISNHEETKIGELLLYNGAKIYASDQSESMPLHSALKKGYIDIVEMFLKHRAEVDLETKPDDTLLYSDEESLSNFICRIEHERQVIENIRETYSMALHIAVMNYVAGVTETLLKYGADVNLKTDRGKTLLHLAVKKRNTDKILDDIFRLLLENGADVNALDETGSTALHEAVIHCPTNVVEMLLKYGADVHLKTVKSETPLHLAVRRMNVEICELLLERGADANTEDKTGSTALHEAVCKCPTNVIEMLLKYGADVHLKTVKSETPLHLAVRRMNVEICELLLERGADVNAKDITGLTALQIAVYNCAKNVVQMLSKCGFDVRSKTVTSDMQLHFAMFLDKNTKICELLLKRGADANTKDKTGSTALHEAVDNYVTDIVEVLLKYGADVNIRNRSGETPLHFAVRRMKHVKICEFLLERGADVNAKDKTGSTALHEAVCKCPTNVIEMLLKHGADVNLKTDSGETPLHLSVRCMKVEICELLLQRGAEVNAKDETGSTALHKALNGYVTDVTDVTNVVEMLLEHGADVNLQTDSGETPLHLSAYFNSYIVTLLLERGANVNMVNKFGKAAFQLVIDKYVSRGIHGHLSDLIKMGIAMNEGNLEDVGITSDNSKEVELIRKCEKEVQRMRSLKINKTNVTFHDILTKSVDQIALYARNADVVQALRLEDYQREFPEYAGLIKGRFNRGLVRKKLLDEGHRIFSRRLSKTQDLPFKCIDKILNYLSNWNLLYLEIACLF